MKPGVEGFSGGLGGALAVRFGLGLSSRRRPGGYGSACTAPVLRAVIYRSFKPVAGGRWPAAVGGRRRAVAGGRWPPAGGGRRAVAGGPQRAVACGRSPAGDAR